MLAQDGRPGQLDSDWGVARRWLSCRTRSRKAEGTQPELVYQGLGRACAKDKDPATPEAEACQAGTGSRYQVPRRCACVLCSTLCSMYAPSLLVAGQQERPTRRTFLGAHQRHHRGIVPSVS